MKATIERFTTAKSGTFFMMGDEASAEGAIAAGCDFFAGYPITPASEVMLRMIHRLKETDGKFIQMEDEIGSICAMIGASWAGSKAMTATSGPGLSLMMESVGYACMTETPVVIVDVQRAGPSTGQATRPGSGDVFQVKFGSHADYEIIAYSPWSVQEMFDLTVEAFNMSETYRIPVFVLADEAVGHLREKVVIPGEVERKHRPTAKGIPPFHTDDEDGIPPMPKFGDGENLLITGSTHDEKGFRKTQDSNIHRELVKRLVFKVRNAAEQIIRSETYLADDADILIVAYGFSARAAVDAIDTLRGRGIKVGLFRPITLWPFPEKDLKTAAENVDHIVVPEMNMGQVSREVERILHRPVNHLAQVDGEGMRPATIIDFINALVEEKS